MSAIKHWIEPLPPRKKIVPSRSLIMVGTFPPPVQGMSAINAAVRDLLADSGAEPAVVDLSPASIDRRWRVRLTRVATVARRFCAFQRLLLERRRALTVYLSLSGGWGQVLELPFVALARVFRARLIFHHHSFAYVDQPRVITRALFWIAGKRATHVTLCKPMAKKLRSRYRSVGPVIVVSNAAILKIPYTASHSHKQAVRNIGFLGNISLEKGILEFLQITERLATIAPSIKALIAGPFQTPEVEAMVRQRLEQLKNCTYIGPQFGSAKKAFYDTIDVLMFPSKYVNEAEPLTVYEAMMAGVAVIAWDRGCLQTMLSGNAGTLIARHDDFIAAACDQLQRWSAAPEQFREVSRSALESCSTIHRANARGLDLLLRALLRTPLPGSVARGSLSTVPFA
jgi:glycosyltransferase involved in cell wall biosynthesis